MNYQQMYDQLTIQLHQQLPRASTPQIRNQALVALALAYSPNCHLATLATLLPVPGQRENLIHRIRRWLPVLARGQPGCDSTALLPSIGAPIVCPLVWG
jgi:hypothetical protein